MYVSLKIVFTNAIDERLFQINNIKNRRVEKQKNFENIMFKIVFRTVKMFSCSNNYKIYICSNKYTKCNHTFLHLQNFRREKLLYVINV